LPRQEKFEGGAQQRIAVYGSHSVATNSYARPLATTKKNCVAKFPTRSWKTRQKVDAKNARMPVSKW